MRAIILAGGLGTRLRHLIPDLPKPMAPVGGRPFLEYVLQPLIDAGLDRIVMSVGYKASAIQDHFGSAWGGATIDYAQETEPLGTGGAIAFAARGGPEGPVLVVNGDTLLGLNFKDLLDWRAGVAAAPIAMVLRRVEDVSRYGAVDCVDGVVSGFAEKGQSGPGLINAGVYLIDPTVFDRLGLSGRFSFEADVLQAHLPSLRPPAYITDAYFIDIGVAEDYARAQREVPRQTA